MPDCLRTPWRAREGVEGGEGWGVPGGLGAGEGLVKIRMFFEIAQAAPFAGAGVPAAPEPAAEPVYAAAADEQVLGNA